LQPDGLTQASPHPVTIYCATERSTHSESYPQPTDALLLLRPGQIKNRHVSSKMPPPLFVNPLKIDMPKKMSTAWEPGLTAGARRIAASIGTMAFTTHDLAQAAIFRLSPNSGEVYSRKPGFTATRLRPLARRREITAWPLLVFIRVRKPCVFER
jgi:hypothetical protein